MTCTGCNGKGYFVIRSEDADVGDGDVEFACKKCGGSGQLSDPIRQDTTSPFNDENTKLVPDAPGIWFYHATKLPVHVTRHDNGELYFRGGQEGEEEMKVSEFARIKAEHPTMCKFMFTKLVMIQDSQISSNN